MLRNLLPVVMLGASLAAASAGERLAVDPSALALGALPADFQTARTGKGDAGQWAVVKDDTADRGQAIAQLSADRTDYRFPLAIYQPVSAKDVDVTLRFKPVSGKDDAAGGIAVRLTTPDNYYVVRANALEDNVRFYRVVKGKREELKGSTAKVAPNQWHTLGLRAEGDRFTVTYDGTALFTAVDRTFSGAGKVALWTKADSITHFDRIEIRTLP